MPTPLVCFPFAGAGASFYRPWRAALAGRFDLLGVQLPGREQRFNEAPYTDVAVAVAGLLPSILSSVREHDEVVVFGHSLGAVLAYELTRRLVRERLIRVRRLVVSGSPSPHAPREQQATGLSDDEFLRQVSRFAGYSHPALEDPEMRELILPTLRADVEMHERYLPLDVAPLPVPITSVRGCDDHLVTADDADGWQAVTTLPLERVDLPGGHMYLVDQASALFEAFGASDAIAA